MEVKVVLWVNVLFVCVFVFLVVVLNLFLNKLIFFLVFIGWVVFFFGIFEGFFFNVLRLVVFNLNLEVIKSGILLFFVNYFIVCFFILFVLDYFVLWFSYCIVLCI